MPPVGGPGHGHHVNPAFFNSQHQGMPPSQGNDPYHGPGGPNQYNDSWGPMGGGGSGDSSGPPLSEAEFEEIMAKNRSVSSSAISRAVADAAAGMY